MVYYISKCFLKSKRKWLIMNNNLENQSVAKSNINWLACIYDDYHLNPYKMGVFKN